MRKRRLQKSFAILAAAGLFVAACGGDDDDSSADDTEQGDDADDSGDDADDTGDDADDSGDDGDDTGDDGDDSGDDGDDSGDDSDVAEAGDEAEGDVTTEVEEIEDTINYGGDVSVGLEAEATSLQPWEVTCSSPCYNIVNTVYDKLLERSDDGDYAGFLAEDISPNEDFTVWTLNLRPGVVFHNGVELTAQTIADMYVIQQAGTVSAGTIGAANLATVEATGDLEVTYTLSASNSAFPANLERGPLGMVFEPAAQAADPDGFGNAPVGTGPFIIESRDLDNETVLVRNENYWGVDPEGNPLPYLDSISFRPIPDEGTRLDAVLSGTVTAMATLRQGTIRDARAAGGLALVEHQGNVMGGGMFNMLVPPFDDLRVRKGLNHLNDQTSVIAALGGEGISLPGTQMYSPDSPWYSEAVAAEYTQFDFEAGVALLSEYVNDPERSDGKAAGEKIDVELSCPPDPTLQAGMQVVEQVWSASEMVNVNLTSFDQPTHINTAIADEHRAHCWRFSDDNDPSVYINSFLAPPTAEIAEGAGIPDTVSATNWANWWNQEAYDASIAATQTDNFDERYALYETIGFAIAADNPIWFSGSTATMIATDEAITGLVSWHLPDGRLGSGIPNAEGHWAEVFFVS